MLAIAAPHGFGLAMESGGVTGFTNPNEEISTIFVVGFPEDMQEREFQNMFIFSPGFEAATLKIPSCTQEDVDVIHGLLNNTRKQSIGFAKFRSRVEALEARDILSGRKVDAEKGCILKAEMAKKNLHTKRGLSNDQSCSLVSPSVASARKGFQTTSAYDAFYSVPACGPAFSSDSLSPQDYTYELACGNGSSLGTSASMDLLSPPITASSAFGDIPFSTSTQLSGLATALDNRERVGGLVTVQRSHSAEGLHIQRQLQLPQQQEQKNEQLQYPLSNFSQIMRSCTPSQMSRLNSTQSLLDLSDFSTTTLTSELGAVGSRSNPDLCSSISQSVPPTESQGFHSVLFGGAVNTGGNNTNGAGSPDRRSEESPINVSLPSSGIPSGLSRFGSLSINTTAANNLQNFANTFVNSPSTVLSPGYLPSPGLRSSNPGDQNPPCNTLYVGNLPANTNEEELRVIFSKCVGYKRMCFRTKANGPMCFVEFDDVMCATQALHDLYGTPLSNSVKGGIRLSYSKNPLGVRQHPTFPSPVSVPNGSMYIPSGPLSAPPTTITPPFSAFGPVTREIMGSAAGSSYGSSLRESGGNGYASSLLREGMTMKRSGSASSIGTIGQPINQQCSTLSTNRTAVNNNNNNNTVASFSLAVSNSISPALAPVGTPAATNQLVETAATTPPLHQPHGIIGRELLRTLSSETVSAFIEDVHMDPSPVKVEYEPQNCIEYPPILGDRDTENSHNDGES